ncbi:MAG TPA: hypothetical protein VFN26_03015 [Candidatus Acidoferrum sp.]|nr:hypothetical protein [Candidatus Acidoferrum sp.]
MSASARQATETRRCSFCGKAMAVYLNQCPFCREMVPQVSLSRPRGSNGRQQIRRGLLYMLLAAVVYYFAGGYGGPLRLPVQIVPTVTNYFLPLLFLGGLGFCAYGLILRARS